MPMLRTLAPRPLLVLSLCALANVGLLQGCSGDPAATVEATDDDDRDDERGRGNGGNRQTSGGNGSSSGGDEPSGSSSGEASSSGDGGGSSSGGSSGGELEEPEQPPAQWPSCDQAPSGVPVRTLHEIWQDNPSEPVEVWVPGVYITAISGHGCTPNKPCQLFVQQAQEFVDLAAASKQSLRVDLLPNSAQYFDGLAVGDRINLRASVWRHAQGELFFQVRYAYPGCASIVSSAHTFKPVTGLLLADLTPAFYEQQHGPMLVKIPSVTGWPKSPTQLFPLRPAFGAAPPPTEVTNLSPYFLPGNAFSGFVPEVAHNFESVTGIFALYSHSQTPETKYEVIYPRTMAELPLKGI